MSLNPFDSLPNVTELYQSLLGGESMSSFQPIEEAEDVEVPLGTELQLSGALKGWTLWHLNDDGKKKWKTSKDWRVTAGPGHIRKINKENAEKGLPRLKENFRRVFDEKEDALQFIGKFTTRTLETAAIGKLNIPAYLVPQIMTVVAMIVGETIPHAKDINVVTAVQRESVRLSREQKTVKELVLLRAERLRPAFDPKSPLRALQYPRSSNRLIARVYFELIDFLGEKMVYDVTTEDAKNFVKNVRQRRREENRAKTAKNLADGTLRNLFGRVNAMFKYALEKHWCDENPFEELFARISEGADVDDQKRKDERKPHDIKLLQALVRAAWHENKLICLAYLLAVLEGLRRCEILRGRGSCIRLTGKYRCLVVDKDMVKKRTEVRFVPFTPSFRPWLPVFQNVLQLDRICGFTEQQFSKLSRRIREQVSFKPGGKDEMRKDYTLANQGAENEIPPAVRALIEGHSEDVMRISYNGDASPEFSEEFDTMLDPISVLGFMPEPLTLEELKACVPKPSKGGGRTHRKYIAKMEALRIANEKNKSTGSGMLQAVEKG